MAKQQKSAVISGAGFVAGFMTDLVNAVREQGGTDDDLYRLVQPDGRALIGGMAKLVVGNRLASGIYPVTVDYGASLQAMIDAGHYDWWSKDILKAGLRAEGTGIVEVNLELYDAKRNISSSASIAEVGPKGYRAANHAECLAFGAKYPDKQREFPIIALGSVGRLYGSRHVVFLHCGGTGRGLGLYWYDGDWSDSCRFLVARKQA